ncbi:MAG: hypothetical protein ACK5HT_06360 [Draconibacterium sp.]
MKVKITAIAALTLFMVFACTGDLEDKIDELSEQLALLQNSFEQQKQDMLTKIDELKKQNDYNQKELEKLDEVMNTLAMLDNRTKSDSIQLAELMKELNSVKVNVGTLERISKTYYGDLNLTSGNTNAYDRYEYLNGNLTLNNSSGSLRGIRFKLKEVTGILRLINVRENWPGLAGWFFYLEKVWGLRIENSTHPTLFYLSSLKEIRVINIVNNPGLTSLEGLENIERIWFFNAENNTMLSSFCALQRQFAAHPPSAWYVSGNAYNPTIEQVKNGECEP